MADRGFSVWLQKMNSEGHSQRMRRFAMVMSLVTFLVQLGTAVMDLCLGSGGGYFYGGASCIASLGLVGLPMLWIRTLRRNASAMSWDDRAQMDFGVAYGQLSSRHKFDVRVRVSRDMRFGDRREDERDIELQHKAERRAFQILKIALPVLLLAYWVVCLCMRPGELRRGLIVSAVVFSCATAFVIVLPDVIRLWTQPDGVRELSFASHEEA